MSTQLMEDRSVSVVGLDAMGAGIARTFLDAGYRVSVWNRSRAKIDPLVALGAIACDGPREALEANVHVVVCLAGYPAWMKVVEEQGLREALHGRCIIQVTGGTDEQAREHADLVESCGGQVVEGALMCYPDHLGTGDASILVSGAPGLLEACDELLRTLAPTWTNLGEDLTAPSVLSRALFTGFATSLVGFLNSVAVARAGGISMDVFREHSMKVNDILASEKSRLVEAVRDGRMEETQASIRTCIEAHDTSSAVARSLKVDMVLQDAVDAILQKAAGMGLAEHDMAALVEAFAPE